MKKSILFVAMFAMLFSLVACGKKAPKDLVAKKWKFDIELMAKEMKDNFEKRMANEPDSIKAIMKENLETNLKSYPEMLGKNVLEFKSDGTFSVEGPMNKKGKWTMSEDGKSMSMIDEIDGEVKYEVTELTDGKLTIKMDGVPMYLVAA